METSLRVVLLLVGVFIIVGITWDWLQIKRVPSRLGAQRKSKAKKDRYVPSTKIEDNKDFLLPLGEEVILKQDPLQDSLIQEENQFNQLKPIILHVMARQPGFFQGKKLLEVFKELSLFYGEMQIYHQFEHSDGTGNSIFSVASAVEPGIFDLSKMDNFTTPGLSLFFNVSRVNQSITAFECMLRIARQLAQKLDGELRDENRRILTNVSIEKYREKVKNSSRINNPS